MADRDNQGGNNKQDITEDIDAYYQPDKSSSGTALLYGIFALVVTLIVAAGLFFGGRAVYRALTGTSSSDETSQQEDQGTTEETENTQDEGNGQNQTPGVSSDTPNGSGGEDESDSQSSDEESSDTIPSTGDSLPRTGSPSGI